MTIQACCAYIFPCFCKPAVEETQEAPVVAPAAPIHRGRQGDLKAITDLLTEFNEDLGTTLDELSRPATSRGVAEASAPRYLLSQDPASTQPARQVEQLSESAILADSAYVDIDISSLVAGKIAPEEKKETKVESTTRGGRVPSHATVSAAPLSTLLSVLRSQQPPTNLSSLAAPTAE
jgi:hypothetical protein